LAGEFYTISVPTINDNIAEPEETFFLNFSNITNTLVTYDAQAIGTITDNDATTINLVGFTVTETDVDQVRNFTITLSHQTQEPIEVSFAATPGTAVETSDYIVTNTSVIIPALTTSVTLPITIVGDVIVEPQEQFTGTIAVTDNAGQTVNNGTLSRVITINDNDAATIEIDSPAAVTEGTGIEFTVTLTGSVQNEFTIDYSTQDGSAEEPGDYTAIAATTLTFGALNDASQSFTVTTIDDAEIEPTETFYVNLQSLTTGGQNVTNPVFQGTGTILDNDQSTIAISSPTVNEAAGTVAFTVTLTGDVKEEISFDYATSNGTAIVNSDYFATTGTLYFGGANASSQDIVVSIINNNVVEPDETFNMVLSSLATNGQDVIFENDEATLTGVCTIEDDDVATLSINDRTVNESTGTVTFSVTLNQNVQNAFTVDYQTNDDTAVAPDDYTAKSLTTLNFGATNSNTQSIVVTIINDDVVEASEQFYVDLLNLTTNGQAVSYAKQQGVGTITDNDAALVSINSPTAVTEGATITFTVTVDKAVQGGFSIAYSTTDGTAVQPGDYISTSGTLTFAGTVGETETFTVTTIDDNILELQETFSAILGAIIGAQGTVGIGTGTGTGTINDNDAASIAIADVTVGEGDGTATFTVTLTGNVQESFSVNYATSDGTATAGSDYLAANGTLTFPANSSSGAEQTFTVTIIDDNIVEPQETFTVTLSDITGGLVTIGTATATGTINDNDQAIVSINSPAAVTEGSNVVFTVTVDKAVQGGFTVAYNTANGSATLAGLDYTENTGTLTFTGTAGETKNITVATNDDGIVEATEAFTIVLSSIGATTADVIVSTTNGTGTGTLLDNDVAYLELAGFTVTETNTSQTANFTLTSDKMAQHDIELRINSTDISALAGEDYTALLDVAVVLLAGQTSVNIPVTILGDLIAEPTETFSGTISLHEANGQQVIISTTTATGTITDDDAYTISIANIDITETDANVNHNFVATMSGVAQSDVVISFTTTNGAAGATDFTAQTAQLYTIEAGQTSVSIPVEILGDQIAEAVEAFTATITISNANGQPVTIGTGTATGTITDDDEANISIANVSTDEDIIGGKATFTVTLNGSVQHSFTVNYSTSNITAIAGSDYQAASGFLTFPGNSNDGHTETFTVNIINDNVVEGNETYLVTLSGISGGIVTIGNTTATGTIIDDDEAIVSINSPANVYEGNNVVFSVSVDKAVQGGFTVAYTTVDGTATVAGSDYTPKNGEITFSGLQNESHNIVVATNNDNIVEATETFTLELGAITNNAGFVTVSALNGTGTGTLLDNDYAAITIADVSGAENGGDITVSLVLDSNVDEAFTVNVNTSDGTATSDDYVAIVNQVISFDGDAGEIQTFVFTPVGDDILENDETVLITMSGLSTTRVVNITDGAVITILNDDSAALTINDQSATEGDDIVFTLELTDDVQGDVVVDVTFVHGTTKPGDFTATKQTFTFANGAKGTKSVVVPTNNDNILEEDETFTVYINLISGNSAIDDSDTGIGTIIDNDAASVTISDASVVEGGNLIFNLTLTNDLEGDVEVQVYFENITTSNDDYTTTAQNFTFAGGLKGTKTFTVPTTEDNILEADETFTARISFISGNTEVDVTDTGIGTILNNDASEVTIAATTQASER